MNLAIKAEPSSRTLLKHAFAFVEEYYRNGHEGKTVIIGCNPKGESVAFAAGLSQPKQQKQLTTLARYIFAVHNVDCYLVFLPAWLGKEGEREVVAVEMRTREGRWQLIANVIRDAEGHFHALEAGTVTPSESPLLDHLLIHGQALPGLMRRELDLAYLALRIATPPQLCPAH